MQLKALLVCAAVAGALNVKLSAADVAGVPHGWTVSGDGAKQYEVGYDYSEHATYVRGTAGQPAQTMSLSQALDPQAMKGRLVQISAEVRDDDPNGRLEFYLHGTGPRTDGANNETLAVTTTASNPGEWQELHMKLKLSDGEKALTQLALGFAVQGEGRVWMRNVKIEDVKPVDLTSKKNDPLARSLPLPEFKSAPTNFEMAP
ncbi:MAG: hypothetical protein JO218_04240 [Burkholderiales bacterium]|nr:hypothetical protein [Burkholderiales bacterium]